MKPIIYLDNQSTTAVDPEVIAAMEPFLKSEYGNAASKSHLFGWKAEAAVEHAREQVAQLLNVKASEIIFTSGATESNNIVLLGMARAYGSKKKHLITAQTEHKAVLDPCQYLERQGFKVTYLSVDSEGKLDLDLLKSNIRSETLLISFMAANNEIGILHPLEEIHQIASENEVFFHSDAAQAVGKIPLDLSKVPLHFLSISAHKLYGPKGVGALFIREQRPQLRPEPILFGGGHEHGLRSGTLNVPGIVGLGKACEIAQREGEQETRYLSKLRDRLKRGLFDGLEEIKQNGALEPRLANNLNLCFKGVQADHLMMELKDIAVSSGSACSSADPQPSHVLSALGLKPEEVTASIRFGLGRFNTEEEVDFTIQRVVETVKRLRKNQ